ncbi:dihydrofolate reductase family protein [Haliangium sp. UPWRP_2]|uniref:dihydrofolate reductase family protein n=1 Tax=Haliangium sp. UPWRP_2 TaxID=1931276 RepID=UPI000B5454F2|nr:dihydrofolate reductase family protein [Haliangium sp. UPWRP_2]PSM30954.1 deaminase [Haliangium sp. UPWRP_2]HNN98334.1 dihydrofolate reductase family protein [Pseudomonadota bacterium]
MGKLTVTTFVSLDGVMQAPGGPTEDPIDGFPHGGWGVPHFDQSTGMFMGGVFARAEAFLLGRRTYDIFASYWPKVTEPGNPVADALNRLPKHVASTRLRELSWQGSSLLDGDVPTAIRRLKEKYSGELQVHGSCGLLQTLWQHDLIDEIAILQFPTVLGTGRRLFGPGTRPLGMRLLKSESTPSGIVCSTYARDGALRLGAIEPRS